MSSKHESVSVKTFKKWSFSSHFSYDLDEVDNRIAKLRCETCTEYWLDIQNEAKRRSLRGAVLDGVKQYIDGVSYIHKANVERHCKPGSLHEYACKLKLKLSSPSSVSLSRPSGDVEEKSCPPSTSSSRIGSIFLSASKDSYAKLFRTCLFLVLNEEPFTKFDDFVQLQNKNGLKIMQGKTSRQACVEMASHMADVVRGDIREELKAANFISGLQDGSEARKTREEKELIYVKLVKNGKPVYFLLKCVRMRDFGGTDAACLKRAFLDTFSKFGIDFIGTDSTKVVCVCADGASVNMGKRTGCMTVLQAEIPSLLIIHCSLHKLELGIADAFKKSKEFGQIDEMMLSLYLLFKNSGKNWRMFILLAERLGVRALKFPKTSGTRFQSHKQHGLNVILFNFCVFLVFAENIVESKGLVTPPMRTKITGFYKKMIKYDFLGCAELYREILEATTKVSLVMEKESTTIVDIFDVLDDCAERLDEIIHADASLPKVVGSYQCSKEPDDTIKLTASATNLPGSLSKEDSKLTDRQRESLNKKLVKRVSSDHIFQVTHVANGENTVRRVKTSLVQEINECINTRFSSLRTDDVIKSITIIDHTRWDSADDSYGMDEIDKISEHFKYQLSAENHSYNNDHAKSEFRQLKRLHRKRYPTIKDKLVFWEKVFSYHLDSFRHILLVIEICLCVAWAQGTVERGFSVVGRHMTNQRTSLMNEQLDNLLCIRINLPTIGKLNAEGQYEESVINRAVDTYLAAKKWRWDLKASSESTAVGPSAAKQARIEVIDSDNDSSDDDCPAVTYSSDSDEEDDDGL